MILCAMFSALISIGAFLKIPVPIVPFTLQFFFTTMAGLLLGAKLGFISVMIYVILGLAGVPVFASGGGIEYVLQPSFGYLIGFALGSFVTGKLSERHSLLLANFAGLFVVYLLGMIYYALICNFYLNTPIGFVTLFVYCFVLAVPGDIALCFAAASLGKILLPLIQEGVKN